MLITSTSSSKYITYSKTYAGIWFVTFLITKPASLWLTERWMQLFAFTSDTGIHDVFAPALLLFAVLSVTQLPSF